MLETLISEVRMVALTTALSPASLTDASGEALAVVSFLSTTVFGGAVVYRYEDRVDDAVSASTARPLLAVVYGIIGVLISLFLVVFSINLLLSAGVGAIAFVITWILGAFVLGALGGFGFAVVGSLATSPFGVQDPWIGLISVGALGAVAWVLLPFVAAAAVWMGITVLGIGSPTREWVHRSATEIERQ